MSDDHGNRLYRGCYRVGDIACVTSARPLGLHIFMITPCNFDPQLSCYSQSCHSEKSSLDGRGQSRTGPTIRGNHPCALEACLDSGQLGEYHEINIFLACRKVFQRAINRTPRERCALCDYALV